MSNLWKEEPLKSESMISLNNVRAKHNRSRQQIVWCALLLSVLVLTGGQSIGASIVCKDIADVYIDEWYPDENFNYKTRLVVATNKNIHHGIARTLFRFEIPSDIEVTDIKSACIYLSACANCGGGNGGTVGFFALNKPFDEATETWSSLEGGDWDDSVYSEAVLPAGNSWNQAENGEPPSDVKGFNITPLLQDNLEKVRANGIMMRFLDEHQEPFTHQNVASRESTDPLDFSPRLIIQQKEPICPAEVMFQEEPETLHQLRRFRDQVLEKTPAGRTFIGLYYDCAPKISALLSANEVLRLQARTVLKRLLTIILP
jgi:hypothetical protein